MDWNQDLKCAFIDNAYMDPEIKGASTDEEIKAFENEVMKIEEFIDS